MYADNDMLEAWVSQVRKHFKHRTDLKEAIKATKRLADDIPLATGRCRARSVLPQTSRFIGV